MIDTEALKNKILDAAFQGRLSNRNDSDSSIDIFLQQIANYKKHLVEEKKLRKEKKLKVISEDEIPYELPVGWRWVRLGNYAEKITDYVASGSFASLRENAPSLKTKDYAILVKTADFANRFTKNLTYTTEHGYKFLENSNLFGGELILSNIGSIGKVFIVPRLNMKMTLAPNSIMIRLTDESLRDYLYYFFLSPQGNRELNVISSGTAVKKFNKTSLKTILIPIAPIEEQQRIVSRIKDLFDKLNIINDLQSQYSENASELKQKILELAVHGHLVPQNPADEPASVLLQKIAEEKKTLVKEGKIKKQKKLPEIKEEEIPFDIPESWEWVRIGDLVQVNPRNVLEDDEIVGFMPMPLLEGGFANKHTYEEKTWKQVKSGHTHFADNDVVIAKITPCFQNRKSAVIHDLPNGYGAGTTELHVLRDNTHILCMEYLLLLCKTEQFISRGVKNFTGTAGQQRIGKKFVADYLVPLPPLNEQKRIVGRVEEIFNMISKLEK